jgi:sterol desaturase/sphingolipid hydroxylase (fatty acid hydroxylase superfamily)
MPLPFILTLPRLHELAAPLYLLALTAEYLLVTHGSLRGHFRREDTHTSLVMGIGSIVGAMVMGTLGGSLVLWAWEHRIATLGLAWWAFVLCFVLDDLRFYWGHRISHRSRWFWAAHVVHHSSEYFNLSTALRQPWTGTITGLVVMAMPLAWLGFHPALIGFCASLNLFYQFFLHTEAVRRLPPWIEFVFNTPSHHRVHHARNPRYLDANYAGTLIIWDRLFGTFVPELDRDPPNYGLVKNVETFDPVTVALGEYRGIFSDALLGAGSLVERIHYVFAPPGFSHDRSRQDSHDIKRAYLAAHPGERGSEGLPE